MKLYNIACAVLLATCAVSSMGCGLLDQGVQKYDTLVDKDEKCNQKWADYEGKLQRRADLIPNLVAVVKGSAAHEHSTLKDVIEARASATQVKLSAAQKGLTGALSKLMNIQESYPTLAANAQFHDLMVQMEGTENRIGTARDDYNASVQSFNLELRRVSGKVMNPLTGKEFKPRVYFSADADAKAAPKVSFEQPAVPTK